MTTDELNPQPEAAFEADGSPAEPTAAVDPIHRLREEREAAELQDLREAGRATIHTLHQLLRNFQLYEPDNAVFERPLGEFYQSLRKLYARLGEVRLLLVEGQPYLGDLRLRSDSTNAATISFLESWMDDLGIGGWSFTAAPDEEALRTFFGQLAVFRGRQGDGLAKLQDWVREREFDWAEPLPPHRFRETDEEVLEDETGARIPDVFRQGLDATQQYFGMLSKAGVGPTLMARKAINTLVDLTLRDSDRAMSTNLLSDREHSLYTHSVHVAVLSMTLGKALEVPRAFLAELGLCGMFHDTGLSQLPMQLDDDDEGIDPETLLAMHPLTGFRAQLGRRGFHPSRMLRAVVNLEHHLGFGIRGDEDWDDKKRPLHPFSRIVAVAEAYVTLTTDTPARPALLPPDALTEIWRQRGVAFDPTVVQALVNQLGRYPAGTLVELNDTSLAAVVRCGGSEETFDRPTVRIVRGGKALRKGLMYDLSRVPPNRLHVVRSCVPADEGMEIAEVLVGGGSES